MAVKVTWQFADAYNCEISRTYLDADDWEWDSSSDFVRIRSSDTGDLAIVRNPLAVEAV